MIGEQSVVEVTAGSDYEIDDRDENDENSHDDNSNDDNDRAVFPLLHGGDVRAALVLRIDGIADVVSVSTPAGSASIAATGAAPASGPSYVLADVEMGVTAELVRGRMTMRDLLSITPGAVIDLDRPAGAPVDVLVNGTLIARGEVVVVDEEFGIRISELVPEPSR